MTRTLLFVNHHLQPLLIAIGLPLIAVASLIAPNASVRSAMPPIQSDRAPSPVFPTCFARVGSGIPISGTNLQTVQFVVNSASAGDLVKITGKCVGSPSLVITTAVTLQGGYTVTDWINSNLIANPTILDAQNAGRVITASAVITLSNLTIQNGNANSNGGGLYARNNAFLSGTHFLGNTAANIGGGIYISGTASVVASTFTSNTASNGVGGGAFFLGTADVSASIFTSNTAIVDDGGGGAYFNSAANVIASTFSGNTASAGGGAFFYKTATVTASTFTNNMAIGGYIGSGGGGVYYVGAGATSGDFVNTLFAANSANPGLGDVLGAAIYVDNRGGDDIVTLRHTTIASPTLGSGSAIQLNGGHLNLTNTIVASYSVGISNTAGTVSEDYNLFFGNPISKTGAISGGAHDVTGSPKFKQPSIGDYHIITGSAAINTGINVGVFSDLDGRQRPIGSGFDIGAYEFVTLYKIYLPLTLKNY